jgi:CubicO group peptidase (beta-lactamase class C family)
MTYRNSPMIAVTVLCAVTLRSYAQNIAATPMPLRHDQVAEIIRESELKINSALQKEINMPGIAVALVSRDEILWSHAFGYRNAERTTKADTNTIFGLLSITKTITVSGLMIAAQEGLINLDVPIKTYLPDFHIQTRFSDDPMSSITIRHLLSMTSGLTHDPPVGNNADPFTPSYTDHIQSISKTWLRFRTGERAEYSNLGIELAAYILETIIHKPFTEYVREKVLDPLGMRRCTYDIDRVKKDDNRAIGYNKIIEHVPEEIPSIAAGGMYASINDMARFLQFQLNDGNIRGTTLIDQRMINQMRTIPFPMKDQIAGYGMGLWVGYYHFGEKDIRWFAHGGGGFGFQSQMKWLPDLGYGVIVLTNSVDKDYDQDRIAEDILLKIVADLTGKKNSSVSDWLSRHIPSRSVDSTYVPANLVGTYNGTNDDLVFIVKDGRFGYVNGNSFEPMIPISKVEVLSSRYVYRFMCDADEKPISVIRTYDGTVRVYANNAGDVQEAEKKGWERYTGSYIRKRYGVGEKFYNVSIKHGVLHFEGSSQDFSLTEFLPGLFFTPDGEAVDFRGPSPTFRNIKLYKTYQK